MPEEDMQLSMESASQADAGGMVMNPQPKQCEQGKGWRDFDCRYYGACLNYMAARWTMGFTCEQCPCAETIESVESIANDLKNRKINVQYELHAILEERDGAVTNGR